jgi:hypothetical protein
LQRRHGGIVILDLNARHGAAILGQRALDIGDKQSESIDGRHNSLDIIKKETETLLKEHPPKRL